MLVRSRPVGASSAWARRTKRVTFSSTSWIDSACTSRPRFAPTLPSMEFSMGSRAPSTSPRRSAWYASAKVGYGAGSSPRDRSQRATASSLKVPGGPRYAIRMADGLITRKPTSRPRRASRNAAATNHGPGGPVGAASGSDPRSALHRRGRRERLDRGEELAHPEGLEEHEVDARQPAQTRGAHAGRHDDSHARERWIRPDLCEHRRAVRVREHEVEHDHVRPARARRVERGCAARGLLDVVADAREDVRHDIALQIVVVDDEDADGAHRRP